MTDPEELLSSHGWLPRHVTRRLPGASGLVALATRAGATAYLHRTPIGARFPGYAERRELRRSLGERGERDVLVLDDVLRTAQVWQWREHSSTRPSATREASLFAGEDEAALRALLARLPATAPPPLRELDPAAVDVAAAALIPALRRKAERILRARALRSGARGSGMSARDPALRPARMREALQRAIEESTDPYWIGALWRALAGGAGGRGAMAVLAVGAEGARMLLASLEVLEPLHLACLERMRSWADDARRAREMPRRARLGAFRPALELAGDAARYPSAAHFARSRVLRDNLYGALPDAAARERCRAVLLGSLAALDAWANARAAGWPEPNLCVGSVDAGGEGPQPEALDLAARAEAVLRTLEDAAGAGWAELARTRAVLAAGRVAGGVEAAFPHICRRGGFDVVLGAGARSAERGRVPGVREWRTRYSPSPPDPERAMQSDTLIHLAPTDYGYPARLCRRLGAQAPAALTVRGSVASLGRPLLALFCSQRVPGSIVLKGFDLARRLRERGVPVVGGFHAALEREWLELLLKGSAPVVLCPARSIEPVRRLTRALREPLVEGRLAIISGFAPTQRRATRSFAMARNRLVAALAERVFIAHADPGGTLFLLAKEVMEWGVPVYTFDDPRNTDLLLLGARPLAPGALPLELFEVVAG